MQLIRPALIALTALFLLSACSVNVKNNEEGQNKKVDIKTPFGEINVDKGADVRDTGLPVYAGARLKQDTNEDKKSANVNISSFGFGLKVVAVEYESDDAPAKVIAYYKDQLKKFGTVLECHTNGTNYNAHYNDDHNSQDLRCEGSNDGKTVELKAGKRDDQHIVAIDSEGKGSKFALVFVRIRGKEDTI
jgi:hypothetical protein